jgi:hypothetical protein
MFDTRIRDEVGITLDIIALRRRQTCLDESDDGTGEFLLDLLAVFLKEPVTHCWRSTRRMRFDALLDGPQTVPQE